MYAHNDTIMKFMKCLGNVNDNKLFYECAYGHVLYVIKGKYHGIYSAFCYSAFMERGVPNTPPSFYSLLIDKFNGICL